MVSGTCAWCDKRIRHRSHGRSKNGLLYLLDTNEISKVIKSEHKRAHESCRMKLVHERPHRNQSLLKLQIIDATKQRQVKLKLQPKRTVRSSLRSPLVATVTAAAATPILMRSSVTQQKPSSIQPQHSRSRGRLLQQHAAAASRLRVDCLLNTAVTTSLQSAAAASPSADKQTRIWKVENNGSVWRWSGESAIFKLSCTPPLIIAGRSVSMVIAKRYFSHSYKLQENSILNLLAERGTFSTDDHLRFVRQRLETNQWPSKIIQDQLHHTYKTEWSTSRKVENHGLIAPNSILPSWMDDSFKLTATLMFFEFYDGTMDTHLSFPSLPIQPSNIPVVVDFARDIPRRTLFWVSQRSNNSFHLDDAIGDIKAMESAACRLVHHLFTNLAAHHRARILLGDIKPANIFFNNNRPHEPVFGDYGHATHMRPDGSDLSTARLLNITPLLLSTSLAYTHHMQQTCDLPEDSSFQAMPTNNQLPPLKSLQFILQQQQPSSATLMGLVRNHIGTPGYQAPETQACQGGRGVYTAGSDAYSLAASIVEILVGYSTCNNVEESKQLQGQRLRALQRQCETLKQAANAARTKPLSQREWRNSGSIAVVPDAIINLLASLLLPPCGVRCCTRHCSVQTLLDAF